ncbi:hypothetical protein NDU88_002476 [Pleurodeles waltl]|uniref:Uncharacterized protein n=1 Tax=Pleurodeles waltl TaxID=8319 RepID=A0AAV7VBB0_PLEWA|nr:hypothetical protein NDU88_002476 [Pleurodeles waltl]
MYKVKRSSRSVSALRVPYLSFTASSQLAFIMQITGSTLQWCRLPEARAEISFYLQLDGGLLQFQVLNDTENSASGQLRRSI